MINPESDIKTRTFGIEIEMCNFERAKISLPPDYSWSAEEEIVNTDGSSNKKFGGEVNTPPLRLCMKDLHGLKSVYESMVDAGGVIKWTTYTHVHIYAGDLSVDQLKKVWLFFYICYSFIKKYVHLSEWDELCTVLMPTPAEKFYEGVLHAETFEDLHKLFTNQSKKGFIRHAFNISSYFKSKTIEFRTFHGTTDFYEAMNCVYSAYRFFYYAISHELEDFQSITTYEQFKAVTRLKYVVPDEIIPLLYQGNPYSNIETFQTKSLQYNSKQASALCDAINRIGHKELCIVNGFMFYYELLFHDKLNLTIYCQDPFCYLLYLLANGKTSLTYKGKLEWLEVFNKTVPDRQVALALYSIKLQKFMMSKSLRNDAIVESLKMKAQESIENTEKDSNRLISMLTTCKFQVGTLQDAIANEKVIFFNYGWNKTQKRTFKLIRENSDLNLNWDLKRNDYYEVVESIPKDSFFYYISNSPYLNNLHKVAMIQSSSGDRYSAGRFLYCNKKNEENRVATDFRSNHLEVNEIVPPSDLIIDNADHLKIMRVAPDYLLALQKKYIKKVDMVSRCIYSFIVMYDKYTLGGFGFTLPKYKGYDLFQMTDFCTNNDIPRLSKFILLCIQLKSIQKELSRRMNYLIENVISLAYTHKPVSMKYRGIYTKVKEQSTSSYLAYEGKLGIYPSNKEIIEKYTKMLKNGKN